MSSGKASEDCVELKKMHSGGGPAIICSDHKWNCLLAIEEQLDQEA